MTSQVLLAVVLVFAGDPMGSAAGSYDFALIDKYLANWDRFANGENALVPYLRESKEDFQANLIAALTAKDKRAPARLVFYSVVQVGDYIDVASPLGRAVAPYLGAAFPITKAKDQRDNYFAGDLYFWWERVRDNYTAMPLFDAWLQRDFARQVVIPMYRSAPKNRDAD